MAEVANLRRMILRQRTRFSQLEARLGRPGMTAVAVPRFFSEINVTNWWVPLADADARDGQDGHGGQC